MGVFNFTYSCVSYTSDGFKDTQHKQLFELCHDMNTKNISMLMSNADVKIVTDSFPSTQYDVYVISCRRAINSKNPSARTNEVLILNKSI
jgi:DNA adenine methylase